jgi:hypothetical protein
MKYDVMAVKNIKTGTALDSQYKLKLSCLGKHINIMSGHIYAVANENILKLFCDKPM